MPDTSRTGIYRAQVQSIADPEGLKRVQLLIPSVLGTAVSAWAWPVRPSAAAPALNDLVYVMFENGDPNHPVYFN